MDKALIVGFLAETELHPGAGQGLGTIDQPVQREGGTGYPVVPGTSYKGAARGDIVGGDDDHARIRIFGKAEPATAPNSGTVTFGDIRLLLLPMRCSETAFKWVTTPHLLERFERDAKRAGVEGMPSLSLGRPSSNQVYTVSPANKPIHIEEFLFQAQPLPANTAATVQWLGHLLPAESPYDKLKQRLGQQLLIMNDEDFGWFCQYGLPVRPHNHLHPETKASDNFWYEEYLPSETLLYAINSARGTDGRDLNDYAGELKARKWLQIGGNETTGEGVCRMQVWQP